MTSATSVAGIPRRVSSQAVKRAPCRTGRVSSTQAEGRQALLVGGPDDADRGAVAGAGQAPRRCSGCTPAPPVREQRGAVGAQARGCARRRRRPAARPRPEGRRAANASPTAPGQVDRGRPGGDEPGRGRLRSGITGGRGQGDAHGPGHPERRGAADGQGAMACAQLVDGRDGEQHQRGRAAAAGRSSTIRPSRHSMVGGIGSTRRRYRAASAAATAATAETAETAAPHPLSSPPGNR